MVFHQAQSQIANDNHRFRVVNCGRRFGKTTLSCYEMVGKAMAKDGRQICYIAPNYQQARDISWELLKKIIRPVALSINESRLETVIKTQDGGKAKIYLRGWESIENLRGQRFDFLVLDEVAIFRNFWIGWHEVLRPTLTDTKGEALFISTPKGFNHFYDMFNLQLKDNDYKSFHFTTYDNTYVPSEEVDKARKEISEDRFAQEYLADFRKQEGLVYKDFSREKHVYVKERLNPVYLEMLSEPRTVIAGIDFGFTNPCSILTIKIDGSDVWWIDDEFYKTGRTDAQVAEYVAAQKFNYVYPDPESPGAIEELRRRKVNVRDVIKGKDSIKTGIDKVRELLRAGKIKINSECINTILEFETYAYPDSKDGNENENPLDEHNHSMDALRYCAMMISDSQKVYAEVYKPHHKYQNKAVVNKPYGKW